MGASSFSGRIVPHQPHFARLGASVADKARHPHGRRKLGGLGRSVRLPDDLGLLTTYRDPATRHFDIFRDTSAATAMAGNLVGRILAALPERWPETVRALMIHSAEWTIPMHQQFDAAASEQQKRALLRKYGYGVPSYERAVLSAANDLTIIAEEELQPFWKEGGSIKTRHMNLHEFPWPRTELQHSAKARSNFE